jgi:TonB family protein
MFVDRIATAVFAAIAQLSLVAVTNAQTSTDTSNQPNAILYQTPGPSSGTSPASIGTPHECKGYYPPAAALSPHGGTTVMAFTIAPDGTVHQPQVVSSSGDPDLDEAAAACVKHWRYRAATANGEPVAAPWRANVLWEPDLIDTPIHETYRLLRADAWRCMWDSPAAKALPADFTAWLEVHIRFSTWLTSTQVSISQTSGNESLDAAAIECVRNSQYLETLEAQKGELEWSSIPLAWWASSVTP